MSDLIERYGYERAVRELKAMDDRAIWMISSCLKYREEVRKECLEYRRQHNIFEVGDKVVFEAHFCDGHEGLGYGEITYCTMDKRVFEIDNYYLISIDEIRHATDLEIQAGRRL